MSSVELASHVRKAIAKGNNAVNDGETFAEGVWFYCRLNLTEDWQWPVYLLATSRYEETEEWLERQAMSSSGSSEKTVWVVMGNDFPVAVFGNQAEAEDFVNSRNTADKELSEKQLRMRIYHRSYDFTLDRKPVP